MGSPVLPDFYPKVSRRVPQGTPHIQLSLCHFGQTGSPLIEEAGLTILLLRSYSRFCLLSYNAPATTLGLPPVRALLLYGRGGPSEHLTYYSLTY